MIRQTLYAAAASIALAGAAQAAFLIIDDSDPDTITITAGDFEGGFFVNGDLLTQFAGESASITLPDGGHILFGTWIDQGQTPSADYNLFFGPAAGSSTVTSGVSLDGSSDGSFGTVDGSAGGFTGLPYPVTPSLSGFGQNDGEQGLALPFLEITFIPEATGVPAPAGLALFGLGLLGLAALRRR